MNVISLFDGMACGYAALVKAGKAPKKYYAAEIDKPAIKIALKNWPDIIPIGDVNKVKISEIPDILDLVIGGSPCQGFSFAGKQLAFDDPRSKLFFEYVRILTEAREKNPKVKFLLENVAMRKEHIEVINKFLGVEPIIINSSLLSAQNRKRLYWTNIEGVTIPNDKGVLLRDILEASPDEKYNHSEAAINYMNRAVKGGRNHWDFKHHSTTDNDKSAAIVANFFKGVPYNVLIDKISKFTNRDFNISISNEGHIRPHRSDKKLSGISEIGTIRDVSGKSVSVIASHVPKIHTGEGERFNIRKLTPIECERLQTLSDNYTEGVADGQRYKMLGNGWTRDVIAHIFSFL